MKKIRVNIKIKRLSFALILSTILLGAALLASCRHENNQIFSGSTVFTYDNVVETRLNKKQELDLSPPVAIRSWSIFDTLLICYGETAVNSHLMHIYGLNSKKLITSFASAGRGPEEFNEIVNFQVIPEKKQIFIPEAGPVRKVGYLFSIDSLVLKGIAKPTEIIDFQAESENETIKLGDNINLEVKGGIFTPLLLMGNNSYIESAGPNPSYIAFRKRDISTGKTIKDIGYPLLSSLDSVLNLRHYGLILYNTQSYNSFNNRFIIGYGATDLLQIFDENLNLMVQLQGPDLFMPIFEFYPPTAMSRSAGIQQGEATATAQSPMDNIVFTRGLARQAFFQVIAAKSGFYALYSGHTFPVSNSEYVWPNTILYFSYSGDLLKKYVFNESIIRFLVSDNEDFFVVENRPQRQILIYPIN